jgi:transketolase
MELRFGPRRGKYFEVDADFEATLDADTLRHFETLDLIYRSMVAILFNYVPTSGHPGGSISSGRFVQSLLFDEMDYDLASPDRDDADILSYAAGHKALGLYALWALRNEIARIGAPELLARDTDRQLRLEDLLGFRRNPSTHTPLFHDWNVKALDGHPTPSIPFVRLATGASGVGLAASLGLAIGARDVFGADAPRVHIVEGEGGLTPGRVAEALAAAGTASLDNAIVHLDWNQASIDSSHVCREGETPGDYVQWNPAELFYLHDWNVISVADGRDFSQVLAAQQTAAELGTGQPTAIVYRTVKGWQYGIEGRASHGAGHGLCSEGFYKALEPLTGPRDARLPGCAGLPKPRCSGSEGASVMEACLWEALEVIRREIELRTDTVAFFAARLRDSRARLDARARKPRKGAPRIDGVYQLAHRHANHTPKELQLAPGTVTTLRQELGRALKHYNAAGHGALLVSAADLLGSTSVAQIADGFPAGFWNARTNPEARTLSIGGICEDAAAGIGSGLGAFGYHIGVSSSYAAFEAPLAHIAARLHAIGNQARHAVTEAAYRPMILVCAHAGLKTGEDGPTHADPQALQLLQENFPNGTAMTLTPWDPAEVWPLLTAALEYRPAVIAPFVTRPNETVPDRAKLRLAGAQAARQGLYRLRPSRGTADAVIVLQESAVTMTFVNEVLPRFDQEGVDLDVYYVSSAELFDRLPAAERERIFPESLAMSAIGITGFTLPTMYRWIRSDRGRAKTLHPYKRGHYPGSGAGAAVLHEAGLDGEGQYGAIKRWLDVEAGVR